MIVVRGKRREIGVQNLRIENGDTLRGQDGRKGAPRKFIRIQRFIVSAC